MKPDRKPNKPQPAKPKPAPKKPLRPMINLGKKNYAIMGAGIFTIHVGFLSLMTGSITLAPILLVLGYCVIIPVALLIKPKQAQQQRTLVETGQPRLDRGPVGIGGWLILPAIGMILGPLGNMGAGYFLVSSHGSAFAVAVTLVAVAASIPAAILFFGRHRWTVPVYIGWLVLNLVVTSFYGVGGITSGVVSTGIWITYLLRSKRVKNTFTN